MRVSLRSLNPKPGFRVLGFWGLGFRVTFKGSVRVSMGSLRARV